MTPEDWKEAEEKLKSFYTHAKLRCDGYEITLVLERISQFRNAIMVYVNGVIKGEWFFKDCEERRRFARPVKKAAFSSKQKTSLKKIPKRVRQRAGLPDLDATVIVGYFFDWTSFRALKSHLIKNNSTIELVRERGEDHGDR